MSIGFSKEGRGGACWCGLLPRWYEYWNRATVSPPELDPEPQPEQADRAPWREGGVRGGVQGVLGCDVDSEPDREGIAGEV
jgi:hypothetical protein